MFCESSTSFNHQVTEASPRIICKDRFIYLFNSNMSTAVLAQG